MTLITAAFLSACGDQGGANKPANNAGNANNENVVNRAAAPPVNTVTVDVTPVPAATDEKSKIAERQKRLQAASAMDETPTQPSPTPKKKKP